MEHEEPDGTAAWAALKRTSALLDRSLAALMESAGINMGEFEVLAALRESGPPYQLRPSDLTRSLIVTPGAITNRLTTLERRDLVVRRGLVDDRRGVVVALTAKGMHVYDAARVSVVERCDQVARALGDEIGPLRSALSTLLSILEAETKDRIPAQASE